MHKVSVVLFFALGLVACAGSTTPAVEMVGQSFEPAQLSISVGDTVSFQNTSSEAHTVTAYEEEIPDDADYFSSGGLPSEEAARDDLAIALVPADGSYEVTFERPGAYRYFCIPHEQAGMKGTIVVEG